MKKIKIHNPTNVLATLFWATIIALIIPTLTFVVRDDCTLKDKTTRVEEKVFIDAEAEAQYGKSKKDLFASQAELLAANYSHGNRNDPVNAFLSTVRSFDDTQKHLFTTKTVEVEMKRQFSQPFIITSCVFLALWVVAMGISLSCEISTYECPLSRVKKQNKLNAALLEEEVIAKHREMLLSDDYNPLELSLKNK